MPKVSIKVFVKERARLRCEYCQLHQDESDYLAFHVEHVIAKQHGGSDDLDNLSFACSECNWAKGPNLAGLLDGVIIPLFNPRKQNWKRHFVWKGSRLIGRTRTGKVTVHVLNINDATRVLLRQCLIREGRFPPSL